MHLPDAFVSPATALAFGGVAAAAATVSTDRLARDEALDRRLPLIAATAALVFALRLVRLPVVGTGACGHVNGGLLAAILLGPEAGFLTLLAVQLAQAVVFADGGLLALGVNAVNAALWPAVVGLPVYRSLWGEGLTPGRMTVAAIAASLVALELGAVGVAVAVGGTGRPEFVSGQFLFVVTTAHVPMAVVEGLSTAAILLLLRRVLRREGEAGIERAGGSAAFFLFAAALFAAAVLAAFASDRPEWPAWSLARSGQAEPPELPAVIRASEAIQRAVAPLPAYGERSPGARAVLGGAHRTVAGLIGAVASAALAVVPGLAAWGWRRSRRRRT
ncbi:MAG TPA: energy-coupling factor ABC transporter permease [Anaeromyxobacteraceae bacterium]|nr:energy-coupling factor ABC transporter permease [Anaeromyxobacteraceae bacterium]